MIPTFSITAKDTGDELITHDQTVFGTVTGVSFENGNAVLRMGDIPTLSDINGVEQEVGGLVQQSWS